ncbi:MAG: SDR family NAD(P)-dependent oxidoreductase [Solirubrobacteraceae bacterium]
MPEPSFDLTGKIAIVTGGSRGLGREICLAYARHGATVAVASRKADACVSVAESIRRETGREALGIGCHVGDWAQCDALANTVRERFGHVDVLVNNAGVSPLYPSLAEVTEDLFDKVIAVNLKGAFRLSALIGSRMAEDRGGSIINISSIGAIAPSAHEVPYAAAKAGLNALAGGMARAFGPTVRVNTIIPGAFLTDISKAWDMNAFEQLARTQIPLQRGGQPHEIVGAALFLASDTSSYMTGSAITIDGGITSSR